MTGMEGTRRQTGQQQIDGSLLLAQQHAPELGDYAEILLCYGEDQSEDVVVFRVFEERQLLQAGQNGIA